MDSPDDWAIIAMVKTMWDYQEPQRCASFEDWQHCGGFMRILLEDCGWDWDASGVRARLRQVERELSA